MKGPKQTGKAKAFFDVCPLYDSRREPHRFEISVSDTLVVRIAKRERDSYIIGKQLGVVVVTAASPGAADIQMTVAVVAQK